MEHQYIGSLLGRTFLISCYNAFVNWNGCDEIENEQSDYDQLEDYIIYEDGGFSSFAKSDTNMYGIFFTMSSKIEIFKVNHGIIICEGLYFNESWDYTLSLNVNVLDDVDLMLNVNSQSIAIFDAATSGSKVSGEIHPHNAKSDSFILQEIQTGNYSVKKIAVNVVHDSQNITLKGIQISLQSLS